MRRTLFFLLFILVSCNRYESSPKVTVGNYTLSDNVSNQEITAFAEDKEGFIWIGTARGLNRFNGYEYWQFFHDKENPNSLCGNSINALLVDRSNRLWVATDQGISLRQSDGSFHTISMENKNYPPSDFLETQNGDIIVNSHSHLERYNSDLHRFEVLYEYDDFFSNNKSFIDKSNKLWVITMHSVQCFNYPSLTPLKKITIDNRHGAVMFYASMIGDSLFTCHGKESLKIIDVNQLKEVNLPKGIKQDATLSNELITSVCEYSPNELLINTHKNGLYLFNKESNRIYHQSDNGFPFRTSSREITCLFQDSQKNLWIGSHTQSFKVVYKYSQQFNSHINLQQLTHGQSVVALAVDNNNNLWIATYSDNLFIYNLKSNTLDHVVDLTSFFVESPYYQDKISSIIFDTNSTVWLKTPSKINRCSYSNQSFVREEKYDLRMQLTGMAEDKYNNIWTVSRDLQLYVINSQTDSLKKTNILQPRYKNHESYIITLKTGNILVASSRNFLTLIDPQTKQTKQYNFHHLLNEEQFIPTALFEDSSKNVWVGVLDQGLYKISLETDNVEKIDAVTSTNIVSIIEDSEHNLWMGTLYGLAKYDMRNGQFFTFYGYDGIGGNQFNKNSVCKLANGNLVFGGTHGLTVFDPANITIERKIPLYFEEIKPKKPLSDNRLKLKYNENDLSISFVALDYSRYPRVRYYYKMEGIDNNWIDARNNRQVAYSNLAPGHYTFKVYVTSNNNNLKLAEKSLEIVVKPSPWLAPWAICIYVLLALAITVYIINLYLKIKNNRNIAQMALREKEHERRVNEMNMSFFNNISHEFRTPLTLIEGPVSTLIDDQSLSKEHRYLLSVVNRNVKRMLKLVNQVLYFNKLDHDAISLELDIIDISHEINNIVEGFEINGQYKEISFTKNGLSNPMFVSLDIDKLEKILNNILSNALKHSPQQGTISIYLETISGKEAHSLFPNSDVDEEKTFIKIVVADEGDGIPSDKLETIFEKYYQVDYESTTRDEYHQGTGIGLYFTRRLVELHHGYVKAENGASIGAQFTVVLPFETAKSKPAKVKPQTHETELEEFPLVPNDASKNNTNQYTVMVIDDDIEIASYLNHLLKNDYNVITKYSADNALPDLEEIQPDIILCDVVMPGMSGYEFCRKIKQDRDLCHIPIVLLTAKSTVGQQIEGLDTGANAYITKPFAPDYLKATIKSQLLNIQNVRDSLSHSTRLSNDKPALSEADSEFMNKIYELLEEELSNSELNVTNLTKKVGMSRTKFYMKMKGLTGENPNVFFRNYKLNRAAELLKSGKYNISEVADRTGFSTLSHFSVSFKKQFGVNPSEYK